MSYILLVAGRHAREEEEKKRKEDAKKRKEGFVEKTEIENPNSRYLHIYRDTALSKKGMKQFFIFLILFLLSLFLSVSLEKYNMLWLTAIFFISTIVGYLNWTNWRTVYKGVKSHEEKEGHTFIRTEDNTRYKEVWVKEKKEVEEQEENVETTDKTFSEWLNEQK